MAIGLDIGSSAVRAVQLEKRRGGTFQLTRYGVVTLPPGAVVDGDIADADVVAGALQELWSQAGLRGRAVAVGLASPRVTVRQIDLPDLPDAELADAVRLQAQDELPIPVDEALLDYVIVDRYVMTGDRCNIRVLLVAAEDDMVGRLLAAVTAAKLRPVLVDLDAFALLRSITSTAGIGDEVELVVDVGAAVTKIAVHRTGHPLFVRMVRFGGDAATSELQKVLDLSWDEAERSKLDASAAMVAGAALDDDDERARVLQSGVHRVITEVRHSLEFFRNQHDVEVQRVLLSGGATLVPNLTGQLSTALELPVEPGEPLRTVDAGTGRRNPIDLQAERPFLGVPVGLAMALFR